MGLSESEKDSVLGTSVVLHVFSFLGSVGILATYWMFPDLRRFSFKLICCLAVADMGIGLSIFMGDPSEGTGACKAQAFIQQWFELSSVLWTTVIAYCLYQTMVTGQFAGLERNFKWFALYASGLPLVLACLPFSTNDYGEAGAWCWIKSSDKREFDSGTGWRFGIFYVELWMAIIFNVTVYVKIFVHTKRVAQSGSDDVAQGLMKLVNRLKYYPLILVIAWSWGSINRIYLSVHPKNELFWLFMLQAIFRSLYGLMNAIAYGLNPVVSHAWLDRFPFLADIHSRCCGPEIASYNAQEEEQLRHVELDDLEFEEDSDEGDQVNSTNSLNPSSRAV